MIFIFVKWSHVRFKRWGNFQNESISKKKYIQFLIQCPGSNQAHHSLQTVSLPSERLWFNIHKLKNGLCENIYLIFNPWWMFSLCNLLMCTNKTCFAGVGTRPKTIFRIRIRFLSYACESKKSHIFLSADQTSIPGVNQVFPVLEWNLIFVLLSEILDRLKRLFVVQIPQVTVYREMWNIYV